MPKTIEKDGLLFNQPTCRAFSLLLRQQDKLKKYIEREGDNANDFDIVEADYQLVETFITSCLADQTQLEELQKKCKSVFGFSAAVAAELIALVEYVQDKQEEVVVESLKSSAT